MDRVYYWMVNLNFQIFIQVPVNNEISSWSVNDILKRLREAKFPVDIEKFRGR